MRKKLAIFDLDGTLIDAYNSIFKTINYICEKLNYKPIEYERVKRAVGGGDLKLIERLFKLDDVECALSLYRKNYLKFLEKNVIVLDGAYELLNEIKKRSLKIALATNRSKFSLLPILKMTKLENFLDISICAEDVNKLKPNPEMILKIIENSGFDKNEAFYIGDMDIDYQTGKNANVDTYIVLTGSSNEEDFKRFANSPLVFKNLNDLKIFLIENKMI